MKFLTFYLLLPAFAAAVVTPPVRAERLNVLSFLNDAFCTTTEKAATTKTKAYSNPPKQVNVPNSEDLSDSKSMENVDTDGFPDLDSDEVLSREALAKQQAPLRRMTGDGKDNTQPMGMTRRLILDHKSQKLNGIHEELQASRESADQDSEEGMKVKAHGVHESTDVQRQARPGIVKGINDKMLPGQSREMLDWNSLEDNNGRLTAGGSSKDADYDETRESVSLETYPSKPSSLSVPAKG
ncbi:uncharacterized protein LOC121641211 [Melanotaenia boesemani]|uniref:uncharacterized protein LOC121641211 n=1 Tax=Melanotaenia boesemani TaxID=1250792 RepID=UPI001C04E9D4|nr:uncharacterized protein LOC121641211 [Melanotaenia boesemani]